MGNLRRRGAFDNMGFWFGKAGKKTSAHYGMVSSLAIHIIFYGADYVSPYPDFS
jgi:hypothetical protein